MNRFTNKNGGILPFQMIKLAGAKDTADVVGNAVNFIVNTVQGATKYSDEALGKATTGIKGHVTKGNNQILGAVGDVGAGVKRVEDGVGALGKGVDRAADAAEAARRSAQGLGKGINGLHGKADAALAKMDELLQSGGKASEAELMAIRKQLQEGLDEISAAYKAGDAAAAVRFNQLMKMNEELAKKLPGRWSRVINGTMIAGGASGLTIAGDRLLAGDANAAHAAGANEGDLAGEQAGKGSWWENTWNDINKFREDHPGWFYGGLGVGLLGGGYALSELLDDDDEDEEENNYNNYRRY